MGTAGENVYLKMGIHSLSVVAESSGKYNSDCIDVMVTPSLSSVGECGPTYVSGMKGPAGGFVFYDKATTATAGDIWKLRQQI